MEEKSKNTEVCFGLCCFCGEDIISTNIDPCRVTVETVSEKFQIWFCHAECFKNKIFKHPQIDLSPAHF
ncbi:MAG: hypothetical protein KJZ72_00810 [Anaerolineales bacterium]|nr:hypothetical protein [Anaerolineales bacterium]